MVFMGIEGSSDESLYQAFCKGQSEPHDGLASKYIETGILTVKAIKYRSENTVTELAVALADWVGDWLLVVLKTSDA